MPAPPEHHPGDEPSVEAPRRGRAERARTAGLLVLVGVVVAFAVLNTGEVTVDWIVGSGRAPLIVVIAISVLVGMVLARLASHLSARKRR
jgi:uncharacterized integral membrane protein